MLTDDEVKAIRKKEQQRLLDLIRPYVSTVGGYINVSFGGEVWQALNDNIPIQNYGNELGNVNIIQNEATQSYIRGQYTRIRLQ